MKRFLITTLVALGLTALPFTLTFAQAKEGPATFAQAKEGPATYFFDVSGTTMTGGNFDLADATGTFKFGVKTDLGGSYKLITTYREIRFAGSNDVKSLQVGGEKQYDLGYKTGFLKGSALAIRGAFDFELNQITNDVNGAMGFGWIKPLGKAGIFAIEPTFDMTLKDGADFVTIGIALNITPPVGK